MYMCIRGEVPSRVPEMGAWSLHWKKNKEAVVVRTEYKRWRVVGGEVQEVKGR